MAIPLSPGQHRVYERLRDHVAREGRAPDLSELARELGMHYVSLKQHLQALADKDYLTFESRGRGRSPRLELPAAATGIPVLGSIPAGPMADAVAHAEAFLPLAALHGRGFALRVQGDSMADLIQDGDVVLFEKRPPARSGEICAVRVAGEDDVTLKYLDRVGAGADAWDLRPHNPAYPTVRLAGREIEIEGVYRGLLRGTLLDLLDDAD